MNGIDPPRAYGQPLATATFKAAPGDFLVEERLGFEPAGEGEHCFVWFEKSGRNTNEVATEFASRLGIRKRLISHCGLKDKQAVTRQWMSIHLPGKPSPTAEQLAVPGVQVLALTRHLRKLHRGSHVGNRFKIRLRDFAVDQDRFAARWSKILQQGVPNFYGSQRFGKLGGNIEQARRFFGGEFKVRDRMLRGILISAARSLLFNVSLANRVAAQNWNVPLSGEVFGFADNRSVLHQDRLRGDEHARVAAGTLELTGPLWGAGVPTSESDVRALELAAVAEYPALVQGLTQFNLRQERRVLRLKPTEADFHWEDEQTLVVRFNLPRGTYATTVLREVAMLGGGAS